MKLGIGEAVCFAALVEEEVGTQEACCGGEVPRPCVGLGLLLTGEATEQFKLGEALEVEQQTVYSGGIGLGLFQTGVAAVSEQDSVGEEGRGLAG